MWRLAAMRFRDYWTIGEVYERLIEDISGDDEEHIIDSIDRSIYFLDRRGDFELQYGFLLSVTGIYLPVLSGRKGLRVMNG